MIYGSSVLVLLTMQLAAVTPTLDARSAGSYLAEAQELCQLEASQLWGVTLCGPTMIVDPNTRRVVANVADNEGALRANADVFVGTLPASLGVANTSVDWNGKRWTMLRWPLPSNRADRAILLMHEAWHRVQPQLGLSTTERVQRHLATLDGRLSMRLELRALQRAVTLDGDAARIAFDDALFFRSWRHRRFPGSEADEAALEANEGLAEYTGWAASGAMLDRERLGRHLAVGEQGTALARNFAYFTGPAYGALLDRTSPGWRLRARTERALPLQRASGGQSDLPATFRRRGQRYGYTQLLSEERRSAADRERVEARWRALLVDGPTLTIPMDGANIVFDPSAVHPLTQGNVYPRLQATGRWGSLDADEGALVSSDWSSLTVTAKNLNVGRDAAEGTGWRLRLAPGWSVQGRRGRQQLVERPPSNVSVPRQKVGENP